MSDAVANTSIAGLADLLRRDAVLSPANFSFNTDGKASPLFLLHAYLGGMLALRHLAQLLPPDQPVYGIQVQGSREHVGATLSVSSLAHDALSRIRAIQPVGRITIGGASAGGIIAFEAARQLMEAGDPEPRVLLLDAVLPHSTLGWYWGDLLLNWRDLLGDPARVLQTIKRLIGRQENEAKSKGLMALVKADEAYTTAAVRRYEAQPYGGNVAIMRTRQARMLALGRRDLGWRSVLTGTVEMLNVPGRHNNMFAVPHVNFIAEATTNWLSDE